eukprot:CAMPEP_0194408714 /NCGR_PEP_ID=MMETSP0176-20130528/6486_1 /TAXON_ID=216777 /ORGANISM="Proboscia alata, Strain PI-D3" /LENGTH=157 /DNA_ID=CAMNT_0039208873 /DNA_START=68 /DNA_END=541 /DNA_ORIENTATION=+
MSEDDIDTPSCNPRGLDQMLPSKEKKTVSFSEVYIQEYFFILGDNPACSGGPPSTISWDYRSYLPISVDEYESSLRRRRKRSKRDFKLSSRERLAILLRSGHSLNQIMAMAALIESTKKDRIQSIKESSRPKILSSASRLVHRIVKAKRRTRSSAAA